MFQNQIKVSSDIIDSNPFKTKSIFLDVKGASAVPNKNTIPESINFEDEKEKKEYDDNDNNGIVYKNTLPILTTLKIMGCLPISRAKDGSIKFKVFSLMMFYSIIVYGLVLTHIVYILINGIKTKQTSEGRFEETVIAYLFVVYLIPICLVPIMWYESRKIAQCFNDWAKFEDNYKIITGRPLPINLRSKSLWLSVMLPFISTAAAMTNHVTMVNFNVVQSIPYCFLAIFIYVVGGIWYLICEIIGTSAIYLSEDFQKALKFVGPASIISEYRALWLRLSKLTGDTAVSLAYSLIFLCLYLFFVITLSIYGLMSQIQSGFGTKDIGLTVTALSSIALLFFLCDEAHYAAQCVRVKFQKKLLTVEIAWMNLDAQTEINMFLKATDLNPTDISLDGFYDVNRGLFKSLLATMVTYLVVLLQFQISLPEGGNLSSSNITTT